MYFSYWLFRVFKLILTAFLNNTVVQNCALEHTWLWFIFDDYTTFCLQILWSILIFLNLFSQRSIHMFLFFQSFIRKTHVTCFNKLSAQSKTQQREGNHNTTADKHSSGCTRGLSRRIKLIWGLCFILTLFFDETQFICDPFLQIAIFSVAIMHSMG